jgi:hypothetical protein
VDDVAAADSGTFLEAVGAACIALESFPLAYARPSYAVVPSVLFIYPYCAAPHTRERDHFFARSWSMTE